jgi:hypothetical protein
VKNIILIQCVAIHPHSYSAPIALAKNITKNIISSPSKSRPPLVFQGNSPSFLAQISKSNDRSTLADESLSSSFADPTPSGRGRANLIEGSSGGAVT